MWLLKKNLPNKDADVVRMIKQKEAQERMLNDGMKNIIVAAEAEIFPLTSEANAIMLLYSKKSQS